METATLRKYSIAVFFVVLPLISISGGFLSTLSCFDSRCDYPLVRMIIWSMLTITSVTAGIGILRQHQWARYTSIAALLLTAASTTIYITFNEELNLGAGMIVPIGISIVLVLLALPFLSKVRS